MSRISVIIPVFNGPELLENCLKSLKSQTIGAVDVLVVDDCSTDPRVKDIAEKYFRMIQTKKNCGPATARNLGVKEVNTDLVAFTDSDCEASPDWLENILKLFDNPEIDAIMGKVVIPKSTYIGDAISCLGFPAGGWVGYRTMYDVDKENFTLHLSTCNCAIRSEVYKTVGMFDESFPTPGREDTEFSYRLIDKGYKIKYAENVLVTHIPRTSIKSLIRMNINRGRGTCHLNQKLPAHLMVYYKKLRYRTTFEIFRRYLLDPKFPMIFFLTAVSYVCLQYGDYIETKANKP